MQKSYSACVRVGTNQARTTRASITTVAIARGTQIGQDVELPLLEQRRRSMVAHEIRERGAITAAIHDKLIGRDLDRGTLWSVQLDSIKPEARLALRRFQLGDALAWCRCGLSRGGHPVPVAACSLVLRACRHHSVDDQPCAPARCQPVALTPVQTRLQAHFSLQSRASPQAHTLLEKIAS